MHELLNDFLKVVSDDTLESINQKVFMNLAKLAFNIENVLEDMLGVAITPIFNYFLAIGTGIIILKFLKKGFYVYILGVEGDASVSPFNLLTNFIRAVVISMSFGVLYPLLTEFSLEIISQASSLIGVRPYTSNGLIGALKNVGMKNLFNNFLIIAVIITTILIWMQFLRRGIQMLVLRVGISWAALGMMDSNDGIFKNYGFKFIQNAITVIVQMILLQLGLALISSGHLLIALGFLTTALKTPNFLNEVLITPISSGMGGGIGTKAYYLSMLTKFFKK